MQLVCMIQCLDDTKMMVASELLNFIENPDIASIPQTLLDYYEECQYLEPSDLEKIVQP